MILTYLQDKAALLRYKTVAPSFIYATQGMDNYDMDSVPVWSVHIPIIEEQMRFDIFHELNYNLRIMFWAISELNDSAANYDIIFQSLATQRDAYLKHLDNIYTDHKLLTVRGDIDIRTRYISQINNFDVAGTAIEFNLPITFHPYNGICVPTATANKSM